MINWIYVIERRTKEKKNKQKENNNSSSQFTNAQITFFELWFSENKDCARVKFFSPFYSLARTKEFSLSRATELHLNFGHSCDMLFRQLFFSFFFFLRKQRSTTDNVCMAEKNDEMRKRTKITNQRAKIRGVYFKMVNQSSQTFSCTADHIKVRSTCNPLYSAKERRDFYTPDIRINQFAISHWWTNV